MRALIVLMCLSLFASCALLDEFSQEERDAIVQETQAEAEVQMVSDGIDPATASLEQWREYLVDASKVVGQRWLDKRSAARGPFEQLVGLAFPHVAAAWAAVQAALALITGRGRGNLLNIVSPKSGAMSSLQSLAAVMVNTHTPKPATGATGPIVVSSVTMGTDTPPSDG